METVIIPMLPRPVRKEEPLTPIAPRPVKREQPNPQPQPADAPAAIADAVEASAEDIPLTASNVLLKAIVETARKPQDAITRVALRRLVTKAAREIALDY